MYLVFDIGASNTRLAFSKDGRSFYDIKKYSTPKHYAKGLVLIREFVGGFSKVKGGAGGIAGSIDKKNQAIFKAPNLPDWSGRRFAGDLAKILRAKIAIENDTALAGLGEATHGPGKGKGIVAYVTVSTGINGALIIEGKLDPTAYGFEIGHQIIQDNKTLEYFVGGASLKRRYKKSPEEILASKQGKTVVDNLSIGLVNTILHWSPEILVLGGSQMNSIKILDIKKYVTKRLHIFPRLPEIKKAALGDKSGLVGALELLKN